MTEACKIRSDRGYMADAPYHVEWILLCVVRSRSASPSSGNGTVDIGGSGVSGVLCRCDSLKRLSGLGKRGDDGQRGMARSARGERIGSVGDDDAVPF